jgi:MFS transporter, UMF1 family
MSDENMKLNDDKIKLNSDSINTMTDSASFVYPADGLTFPVALAVLQAAAADNEEGTTSGDLENGVKLISKDDENIKSKLELVPINLTSRKELFAWWLYYFSYAPVSTVAMILLIPLLLQDLARRAGHLYGDPSAACINEPGELCVLWKLGGWSVTPSAFAYYIIGLSVASQALVFISVGALADYGRLRKLMLTLCTWLGSFSACSMILVAGPAYVYLAAGLTVVLNIFYGTASVFYNAYLPLLVQNHPKYLEAATSNATIKEMATDSTNESSQNHRFFTPQQRKLHKTGEKLSSFISTMGIAAGYSAGIIVILLVIFYFTMLGTEGLSIQICIAICGIWWFIFSAISLWNLKYRPGPELPEGSNYLSFSWKKLGKTLKKCKKLPTTFSFLSCYFFYSDGYNTMGSAAILIARQSLNIGIEKLTICALIAPICAFIGTILFFFVQRTFKISSKIMLVSILCSMGSIPLYCTIGLFSDRIGLRQEWEIYAITSVYGLIIGAAQSFSRVLFAELIPVGDESEFFSLYAITDKGSAFIGPMVIAIMSDYTNQPRAGLIFLAALILVPIPLIISKVDMTKGKQECIKFIQDQQQQQS